MGAYAHLKQEAELSAHSRELCCAVGVRSRRYTSVRLDPLSGVTLGNDGAPLSLFLHLKNKWE